MTKSTAVAATDISSEAELNDLLGIIDSEAAIETELAFAEFDLEAEIEAEELAALDADLADIPFDAAPTIEAVAEPATADPVEAENAEAAGEVKTKTKRICTEGWKASQIIDEKIGSAFGELAILKEGDETLKGKKLQAHIDELKGAIDLLPKKVREKAINVFQHLHSGVNLSVYTHDAIVYLKANGSMTVSDLRKHYAEPGCGLLNKGYSLGTAGAQSSQMMSLLPALGIATRDGTNLTLAEDSILVNMLCH